MKGFDLVKVNTRWIPDEFIKQTGRKRATLPEIEYTTYDLDGRFHVFQIMGDGTLSVSMRGIKEAGNGSPMIYWDVLPSTTKYTGALNVSCTSCDVWEMDKGELEDEGIEYKHYSFSLLLYRGIAFGSVAEAATDKTLLNALLAMLNANTNMAEMREEIEGRILKTWK